MSVEPIRFEVELESAPIRHAYVICPSCKRKFNVYDIAESRPHDVVDLAYAKFECPVCDCGFSGHDPDWQFWEQRPVEIKEVPYPQCSEGALQRKETWE